MARHHEKVELSLFPFLNILFSLIGVLILYIFVILVLGRAGGRAKVVQGKHEGLAEVREIEGELEAAKNKAANLTASFDDKTRELQRVQREKEQLAELLELRSRQETMLAAGNETVGVPIGAPVPTEWRLIPADKEAGDNRKRPILVEITADQYIVHDFSAKGPPQKTAFPAIGSLVAEEPAVPKPGAPGPGARKPGRRKPGDRKPDENAGPQPDPRLVEFLDGVNRARRDKYLLFLIRPEGIEEFFLISEYCISRYTTLFSEQTPKNAKASDLFDFGFEPFSENWLLVREAADDSR
jgi:hypothetical protein